KSQLEAAERLSVTGALPANRLLGLYTARQPAASGGIWDRVAAVQRFETALRSRSDAAISKSLPPAWKAMQSVGLDLIFADLFTASLARYALADSAAEVSRQMHLLSANYNDLAHDETVPPIQRAILNGKTTDIRTRTPIQAALIDGFDIKNARQDLTMMARNGRMGEAILRALVLLDDGASGDPVALRQALSTLRSFGLEDTIRRAALQVLLLERFG
ncbi:MAG: hypothetical protein ABJQ70_06685, partial [Roseobacter sp.]